MARRRSFQTRLLSLMVCALVLFAAATLVAVHVAGQRYLGQTLTDELRVGARVLNRILEARGRQLTDAARVLAADFAFREAIASGDRPTITSALTNLGARVGGHGAFLISLDGSVDADTLGGHFVGRPFPVPSLVKRVGPPAEASATVTLDGRPFQLVVVPVLAPQPIAWVCIAFPIDGAVLEDVRRLTALELSLWASNPKAPPRLISTLPTEKQLALRGRLAEKTALPETLPLGSDTYQTILQPIETGDGSSIHVLLQRSLEEARRPLRRLELQIFALSGAVLLLAIVAAIFFARGVTSPLRRLAEAAQRIGSGDYSTTVEISQDDETGQLAAAFNRMGTEIGAREIERTQLEAQLVRAQKMEAVGQLAGGVAHDFNNLLGVITGNTELLMRDLPPGSRERKRGEEIQRATDRAAALTRQLLAFGRRQLLQPKVLDLNAVVAEVEKMLQRLISASIEIVTVTAADLGQVRADAGQVEQVLLNLAINARDAMPSGGRLVIETANVELDEAYARANPGARRGPM